MNFKKNIFFLNILFIMVIPNKPMQHTVAQIAKEDLIIDTNDNNLEDFFAEAQSEEMPIQEIKKLNWLEKHLCTFAIKIALAYGLIRDSVQTWYNSLRAKK